jgi:hypothetical protein
MRLHSLVQIAALSAVIVPAAVCLDAQSAPFPVPVRGIHLSAPSKADMPLCLRFIREALPKEGVNVLVLEFDYRYQFTSRPEIAERDPLSKEDVKQLVAACRQTGVRLIPQMSLLGHQSAGRGLLGLLKAHPEFDETPGKYPDNKGILGLDGGYWRSYCPLHPGVHAVVFDLMDELADACESDAFHVGMDEVFLIGEDDCPRCKGKNKAELFAQEVRTLRDHLAKTKRTLWMWGDRFLDGEATGIGKLELGESATNGTYPALQLVPKDIVICDWHYDKAVPTAAFFATQGFRVVSSPWRKPGVALQQLELVRMVRTQATEEIAGRMLGVLQTTWSGAGAFIRAYFGEGPSNTRTQEAVMCFRELFREVRASSIGPQYDQSK